MQNLDFVTVILNGIQVFSPYIFKIKLYIIEQLNQSINIWTRFQRRCSTLLVRKRCKCSFKKSIREYRGINYQISWVKDYSLSVVMESVDMHSTCYNDHISISSYNLTFLIPCLIFHPDTFT